jgi:hypothetical protein
VRVNVAVIMLVFDRKLLYHNSISIDILHHDITTTIDIVIKITAIIIIIIITVTINTTTIVPPIFCSKYNLFYFITELVVHV